MDKKYKECEGCIIYESTYLKWPLNTTCSERFRVGPCPCKICLVKSMCEHVCEILQLYKGTINRNIIKEIKHNE